MRIVYVRTYVKWRRWRQSQDRERGSLLSIPGVDEKNIIGPRYGIKKIAFSILLEPARRPVLHYNNLETAQH